MKTIKTLFTTVFFGSMLMASAQETVKTTEAQFETTTDKTAYYEKRGADDARFELEFKAKSKDDERKLWREQEKYEKELKRKNKKAYRVYIVSKEQSYEMHYEHCNNHYHSDSFYHHAGYYYYGYSQPKYQSNVRTTTVNTQIGVRTPKVSLGLF